MYPNQLVIIILLQFLSLHCLAQNKGNLLLEFIPSWQEEPITLPFAKDKTTIEVFRCYIAHFELWNNNQLVWKEKNSFHLLDAEIKNSLSFPLDIPPSLDYNQIKFQLGIDSTTNVSGAFGGDLDPTKGMFWAWNTGYINFKLEGTNPICPTRKNRFQFHLGGYAAPFQSVQLIELPITNQNKITIPIQLNLFLEKINLAQQNSMMTPGVETVELSKIAQQIFTIADEK